MGSNEMCNFYMMYYRSADSEDPYPMGGGCFGGDMELFSRYPPEGLSLLPVKPELEETAHQSAIRFGNYSNDYLMGVVRRKRDVYGDNWPIGSDDQWKQTATTAEPIRLCRECKRRWCVFVVSMVTYL
jgi:hypothetical protein